MESNTSLLFEMRMLNELRKIKPEQRKELIETLEREERLEEEALLKNPNLHVENKLSQVLGELKDLRAEMTVLKNTCQKCPILRNNDMQPQLQPPAFQVCTLSRGLGLGAAKCQMQDEDTSDCGDCSLFSSSSSIDWWPIIIFIVVFLTLLSLPGGKSRPCPITV
jgi:hypothetical protein